MSIEIFDTIKGDDWDYLRIRTEHLFQIYYFKGLFEGAFWQRGRHIADIYISMAGFLANIIRAFGVNPFISLKISTSLSALMFAFIFTSAFSIASYMISKYNYYKLFFISIYLYIILFIVNYTKDMYYIIIAAYLGSIGISFFLFLPILYYFLYEKEILLLNNRYVHYGLYTFFVYTIAFNMEVSSLFISGISFFILIYLLLDAYKKNKRLNPYILYVLILIMIVSPIAIYCTTISGRGQHQINAANFFMNNFLSLFNKLFLFEKILFIIGILYTIYFLIILLKNRKINKFDYMIFAFLITSILGIIGFLGIHTRSIYPFQIILLLSITIGFSKLISKKNMLAFFATIIIMIFISNISIQILKDYTIIVKSPQNDRILYELFIEADKNNVDEIIIEDKDIINKLRYEKNNSNVAKLSNDKNFWFNVAISTVMYNYGITKKYIPISIKE